MMPIVGDKNTYQQSEDLSNLMCLACKDDKQQNIKAYGFCKTCSESLCYTCYIHHTTPRLYKHHVLQKIPCAKSEIFTNKCPHHEQLIQFYCSRHKHYGCSTCFATDHRACIGVTYVEDKYQKLTSRFHKLDAKIKQNSETAKKNKVTAEELYREALNNQIKLKNKIKNFYYSIDTNEIKEAKAQKTEDQNKMENLLETNKTITNTVHDLKLSIQTLYNNKRNVELLRKMEEIETQVKNAERIILKLEKDNTIARYRFEPTRELQEIMDNANTHGEIKYEDKETSAHNSIREACGQMLLLILKFLVVVILHVSVILISFSAAQKLKENN